MTTRLVVKRASQCAIQSPRIDFRSQLNKQIVIQSTDCSHCASSQLSIIAKIPLTLQQLTTSTVCRFISRLWLPAMHFRLTTLLSTFPLFRILKFADSQLLLMSFSRSSSFSFQNIGPIHCSANLHHIHDGTFLSSETRIPCTKEKRNNAEWFGILAWRNMVFGNDWLCKRQKAEDRHDNQCHIAGILRRGICKPDSGPSHLQSRMLDCQITIEDRTLGLAGARPRLLSRLHEFQIFYCKQTPT